MVSERGRARTDAQSRGDGVGSGSSRRKPSQRSMTPGLTGPLRAEGFPVEDERMLPVKLPSGGFGLSKRESSPGGFCPAFVLGFQSSLSEVRVRSICPASHTGGPDLRNRLSIVDRMAGDGPGCLPADGRAVLADTAGCGR
jgi:hypothetical protein